MHNQSRSAIGRQSAKNTFNASALDNSDFSSAHTQDIANLKFGKANPYHVPDGFNGTQLQSFSCKMKSTRYSRKMRQDLETSQPEIPPLRSKSFISHNSVNKSLEMGQRQSKRPQRTTIKSILELPDQQTSSDSTLGELQPSRTGISMTMKQRRDAQNPNRSSGAVQNNKKVQPSKDFQKSTVQLCRTPQQNNQNQSQQRLEKHSLTTSKTAYDSQKGSFQAKTLDKTQSQGLNNVNQVKQQPRRQPMAAQIKRASTPNLYQNKTNKAKSNIAEASKGVLNESSRTPSIKQSTSSSRLMGSQRLSKISNYNQVSQQQNKHQPEQEQARVKSTSEVKAFIISRLTAVFQGYKVRRVLKQNKSVGFLYIGYKDLIKFAKQLKQELADQMHTKSPLIGQTKTLLIQTIKDLSNKREKFHDCFSEALYSPVWISLSKPWTEEPNYRSYGPVNTQTNRVNNIAENKRQETTQFRKNTSVAERREASKEPQQKLSVNEGRKKDPKNDQWEKVEQVKVEPACAQKNRRDHKRSLNKSQVLAVCKEETPVPDQDIPSPHKNEFLKKGLQSRRYNPRLSIIHQKEKEEQDKIQHQQQKQKLGQETNAKKAKLEQMTKEIQQTPKKQPLQKTPLTEPQQLQATRQHQIDQAASSQGLSFTGSRLSQQSQSKIPRLTRKENHQSNQSINCQSARNLYSRSFKTPIAEDIKDVDVSLVSPPKHSFQQSRFSQQSRSNTILGNITNGNDKSQSRTALQRDKRYSQSLAYSDFKQPQCNKKRDASCNVGDSKGQQALELIKELSTPHLNYEAKQKTIETLSAITGMLQSLRDKKLIESEFQGLRIKREDKNSRVKRQFEVSTAAQVSLLNTLQELVNSLKVEFDALLDK